LRNAPPLHRQTFARIVSLHCGVLHRTARR
jgi:hypothetical protein